MGISSWDKGRGYGYQIYREEFWEKLASEPILKLARQRRTKWGGEILPREKKKLVHMRPKQESFWKIQGLSTTVM